MSPGACATDANWIGNKEAGTGLKGFADAAALPVQVHAVAAIYHEVRSEGYLRPVGAALP